MSPIVLLGKKSPSSKHTAAKGVIFFTAVHLLQKCLGIQPDAVQIGLGDTTCKQVHLDFIMIGNYDGGVES